MTRQQGLRTQLSRNGTQITHMRNLPRALQSGSDEEAAEFLLRLRSKCRGEKTSNGKKRHLSSVVHGSQKRPSVCYPDGFPADSCEIGDRNPVNQLYVDK